MSLEKHKEKKNNSETDNSCNEEDVNKNENNSIEVNEVKGFVPDTKTNDETYNLSNEWENVTKDNCQFTLHIGNLEDITILDAIVR